MEENNEEVKVVETIGDNSEIEISEEMNQELSDNKGDDEETEENKEGGEK